MKKYACVLDQLFDGLCILNSFQEQAEVIFALYVCMRKSEEEISFYYWYCHAIKTGSLNKPVGFFQITLSCQGRKKLLMKQKLKK